MSLYAHHGLLAGSCLKSLSLSHLDPRSLVQEAINKQTMSTWRPRVIKPGESYVYARMGQNRWIDPGRWSHKVNRRQGSCDYVIYHGSTDDGHLSEVIRVNTTVTINHKAYGVVYYIDHPTVHDLEACTKAVAGLLVNAFPGGGVDGILDAAQRIVDGGSSTSEAGDSEDSEQARRSKLSLEYILNP